MGWHASRSEGDIVACHRRGILHRRATVGTHAAQLPPQSTLIAQLDIATHRFQADSGLLGAGVAARAGEALARAVFRHPLSLQAHAVADLAAESVDFVVEWTVVACADRELAADGLRLEISALRQFALEGDIAGGTADPDFMRGM